MLAEKVERETARRKKEASPDYLTINAEFLNRAVLKE